MNAAGKSRGWINAKSASLSMLSGLGGRLVDIYGQHDYQTLLEPQHHLSFLDDYADIWSRFSNYPELFREYQTLLSEFDKMKMTDKERKEKEDLLKFRISELERARLVPGEEPEMEVERERLKHFESLRQASELGHKELYLQDGSMAERMSRIQTELEKASEYDPDLAKMAKELSEARSSVEEVGRELGAYLLKLESDPARLEEIEDRLAEIRRLKRKYQAEVPELAALLAQSKKDLEDLANFESKTSDLEKKLDASRNQTMSAAKELSRERKSQAKTLAKKVEQMLKELGMDKSRFEVRFTELPQPTSLGIDAPEFFISPNPGEELKPLSRIASGGELSRIMLALRGILARKISAPVLIFDEVDAGIGGAIAEVVGRKLQDLSVKNQVLCVTHLAQIARFADHHFQVSKHSEKGRTVTRIRPLNREERVEELARMLGGVKITDKTRAVAREMLEERRP
jgi:DNA repair protein RecN (Recombination protein N)